MADASQKIKEFAKTKTGTAIFQVYGMAHKVRRGESDNGPWVGLVGRFEAVRIEDGVLYAATQCFLPEPMSSMIAEELDGGEDSPDSVQFAFEIGVKKSDSPVGYEYTTKPVIEAGGADPLADLRKQLPKLPAPKKKAGK
jgi:hypothetical protein